jgi:hypothetical protein
MRLTWDELAASTEQSKKWFYLDQPAKAYSFAQAYS